MFSLESPQRGDFNEYSQYTISQYKEENHPKIIQNLQLSDLFEGTQERVRNSHGKRAISVRAIEVLLYYMLTLKICVGVFSGTFKARLLKLSIHMDGGLLYYEIENRTPCFYSSLYLSIFMQFFVFEFRRLSIVLQFSYLLLLIYSSALLKQCSGAKVRFSDSSVEIMLLFFTIKLILRSYILSGF